MRYEFINTLRKDYRVTELDHAFRINGVVDVWKVFNTIVNVVTNERHDFHKDIVKSETLVMELLHKYPERPDYKQQKHGISYKEFKNNKKQERYSESTVYAEDYHWKQNADKTSEEHLYFAIVENKVKIGKSINVENRMKQLLTGLFKKPEVYVFLNKGFLETKIHQIFKEIRLNGEWFSYDLRIKYFLKKYHNNKAGYILTPKITNNEEKTRKHYGRKHIPV